MTVLEQRKELVEQLIAQFNTIELDDISWGYDAPTETGEEIEIHLISKDSINNSQYKKDCLMLVDEIKNATGQDVHYDIDMRNTWQFIYIIE